MRESSVRWNHNTHYHPVILDAVPPGCRRALDIGCGEGTLTRELRRIVPEVVGIDNDHASIAAAQTNPDARDVHYVEGDVLTYRFEPASLDLITAVASLHHMDAEATLVRIGRLLRSAGVLAVIGLARSWRAALAIDVATIIPNGIRLLRVGYCEHPSPIVWPPPESYTSMRRIAARVLPDAQFQRRLYWRYTLVWIKP